LERAILGFLKELCKTKYVFHGKHGIFDLSIYAGIAYKRRVKELYGGSNNA